MNNKQQAYIYGAPHEGENFRLSKAENRYLRKRNWIRLLQLIGLFSWASFLLLLPLVLFIPLVKDWYDNGINGLAIFLIILCLFVWFIVWKAWGKTLKQAFKTPWWLSLENAKGITLTGHFGTLIHPTGEIENLWTINNTVVDFPKHWTRSLDKIISNFDQPELVTFRVAKIPQATNKVLRLPMTSGQYFRHRTDIVVADPKYVVLQAGLRSIEEDCRKNIPIHRNNPFLVGMGVMSLVISLFLGIAWHTTIEKEQNAIQTVEKRIQNQIKSIGFERSLEKQELANRDFPLLSAHKKDEKKLLKTDSISYVVVGIKDEPTKNPFILSSEEYRLIYRLSTVSPSVILGYRNKANSKEIDTYRNKLLTIIDKSKNTSNRLQELWKTKVQSMDNTLIEN